MGLDGLDFGFLCIGILDSNGFVLDLDWLVGLACMVGSSGGVLGSGLKATTTMGLCKIDRERGFELKATTIMAGDLLLAMMKG